MVGKLFLMNKGGNGWLVFDFHKFIKSLVLRHLSADRQESRGNQPKYQCFRGKKNFSKFFFLFNYLPRIPRARKTPKGMYLVCRKNPVIIICFILIFITHWFFFISEKNFENPSPDPCNWYVKACLIPKNYSQIYVFYLIFNPP